MTSPLAPGPYALSGVEMECWIVRYDEQGICCSPKTRDACLARITEHKDRPVILFSHGWNNDFSDSTDLYRRFLIEFEAVLKTYPLGETPPVFVGVTWPSIWLPSDEGPQMAADGSHSSRQPDYQQLVLAIGKKIGDESHRARLYELLESETLHGEDVRELARLIIPTLHLHQEEGPYAAAGEEVVLGALATLQGKSQSIAREYDDVDDIGLAGDGPIPRDIRTAGLLDYLDPRNAMRLASLYLMKDRAGTVGRNGIALFLTDLLGRTEARLHLVGHSFGCKVILAALAANAKPSRKVSSVLLLQPAVSHLSFASEVPGRGLPGGYSRVPDSVEKPIFCTYSAQDFPLHTVYHLAMLRSRDLGEIKMAGTRAPTSTTAGAPPNVYAALGGYGPRGCGEILIDPIPDIGELFRYQADTRIVGLDGSAWKRIGGHGGIANRYTAWALRSQMAD
ncbi:pimeloyl-ACP methyl ester carboxylesterase [Bradyrhizobium sp. USDA 4503]